MKHQAGCLEPPCGSSLGVSALLMSHAVCQAGCQEPPPKGEQPGNFDDAPIHAHSDQSWSPSATSSPCSKIATCNSPGWVPGAPPTKGSSLATWTKSRPMLTLTNLGHHLMPAVLCRNLLMLTLVPCRFPTCRCSQPARTHHQHATMLRSMAMILIHHQCTATALAANSFTLKLCLIMLCLPMCSKIKAKCLSALVLAVAVVVL